ncbi:embryogenic cell protein 40-like [Hibiscus syriacus]|uniref:embryogenic cell protein 40-like n=1 Tax=Hibiscus syriacus TaxID=106335 RepID=UPI0019211B93|nr:embryogenic cell protein 40-like [Hibiscus syriacus]
MADLRDVHGNPIQLTDEHGNPVQLTDEHGNPVHVSGVATTHTEQQQTQMGYDISAAYDAQPQQQLYYKQPFPEAQRVHYEVSNTTREEILRSNTSSSSEDDVMCGRRKKKGLKEKIKEKLTGGKHKAAEAGKESQTVTYVAKTSVTTTTSDAMSPPEHHHHHDQHQKKSMTEKIKEKLPGHHSH